MSGAVIQYYANRVIQSLGLEPASFYETSLIFSAKSSPKTWRAYTCQSVIRVYRIRAPGAKVSDIKTFVSGIPTESFLVIAELDDFNVLCLSRHKKGEPAYVVPLRREEDYETVISVFRKKNFTSDELSAAVAIDSAMTDLKSGAERDFINRGLFSNYFLRERLEKALAERKRDVKKESASFFSKFGSQGGVPADYDNVLRILEALGYNASSADGAAGKHFLLSHGNTGAKVTVAIATAAENLDTMSSSDSAVPSVQAVSALDNNDWVILTNGRLWRLYSSRVSSASTNYFEVDLEGITDENDPKLTYFVGLFSANALAERQGTRDLDYIFDGGVQYARELEDDLRRKVFEQQLFLDLVRAVLRHSPRRKYTGEELEAAKRNALKLLYRVLFILYAESRNLLPSSDSRYEQLSLGKVRERLVSMAKDPQGRGTWNSLQRLFRAISRGDPNVNLPQYDGALFEKDPEIDELEIMNKHLVPALRALTEIDGKGIDYQNLGVRQLGSLYEALLEYTVSQAETDLVVLKDEILDMSFASELKSKPSRTIEKGDVYLTAAGLARKGTGSYYTPEKIVKFLVKKGLEPIFEDRERRFNESLAAWRKTRSKETANKSIEALLDIQVVDPAMGSGHFLVTVVDDITRWIMGLLERNPDAPLAKEIASDREQIIAEQKKKGVKLDKELLTFNVILKRRVMKRCIFGVDINPLAVELAKLSLWLDTFTIGTPLTFLDHHIRTGDSLIGLWMENLKARKPDNMTLDAWTGSVEAIGDLLEQVSYPADLTIQDIKKSSGTYESLRKQSEPLRVLLDMRAAAIVDEDLQKRLPSNLSLVEETIRKGELDRVIWAEPVNRAIELARKYCFFHWELEFPDAFTDQRRGFDLLVTNPPWDAFRAYDDEFFSQFYPGFRRIGTKTEKQKIMKKLLKTAEIQNAYEKYTQSIQDKFQFFKFSGEYGKRGSGGVAFDAWYLFLERSFRLLSTQGTMSILLPSGIVNNEGATNIRKEILKRRIRYLYELENRKGIFPDVHRSYKFVLLVLDNEESHDDFQAAFYLQDVGELELRTEKERFVTLSLDFVKLISPESLSIPEIRRAIEIDIFKRLYERHPLFLQGINKSTRFNLMRELHRTDAAELFKMTGRGWPLIEGKNFHQFNPDYEKPTFTVVKEEGLRWTSTIKEYGSRNREIHSVERLVFRDIGGATYVRGMIACIVPQHTFLSNTAVLVVPRFDNELLLNKKYYETISYMAGIFNSMTFDFLIRTRISIHLSFFYVEQTPIPEMDAIFAPQITKIAARLSCPDSRFDNLAKNVDTEVGALEIEKRIEMSAKLDALVAHIYGLTKEEYGYVISTFDVFEEDNKILKLGLVSNWNEVLVRKFNGEVRKRVLSFYDEVASKIEGRQKK